ncbi:hypothetical protein IAR55_006769 [Kwoniella newhampshirensis]|uniref:Uncharacterized protein n=1 Tax=Kwoniella newhampshirensis TaxID=1651941 RepID=A0AAW0YSM6_9TREE
MIPPSNPLSQSPISSSSVSCPIWDRGASKWHSSPHEFVASCCLCTTSPRGPCTGEHYVAVQLNRFMKVWRRIVRRALPTEVRDAAHRIILELRTQGVELTHVSGMEMPCQQYYQSEMVNQRGYKEIRILFFVPDPVNDKANGHRWVADLLVFASSPPDSDEKIVVRGFASRFATDEKDWSFPQPYRYYGDPKDQQLFIVAPDEREGVRWDTTMDKMFVTVNKLQPGKYKISHFALVTHIVRVVQEIEMTGRRLWGFELYLVYRRAVGGGEMYPAIRIGFKFLTKESSKDITKEAVLILQSTGQGENGRRTYVQMSVMYASEWQIGHSYTEGGIPLLDKIEYERL